LEDLRLLNRVKIQTIRYATRIGVCWLVLTTLIPAEDTLAIEESVSTVILPADAPQLLHDPLAVASAPLPDPTPKPVVLPPAVVLNNIE
jgi:hypothetical protein